MAKRCDFCGKGPVAGRTYARRGKAKKAGGVGRRITGVSRRRFLPNLKKARLWMEGRWRKVMVCTDCLKGRLLETQQRRLLETQQRRLLETQQRRLLETPAAVA